MLRTLSRLSTRKLHISVRQSRFCRMVVLLNVFLTALIAIAAFAQAPGARRGSGKLRALAVPWSVSAPSGPLIFMPAVVYDSGGYTGMSVAVGDLNGDGNLDLVVGSECAISGCSPSGATVGSAGPRQRNVPARGQLRNGRRFGSVLASFDSHWRRERGSEARLGSGERRLQHGGGVVR